MSDHRELSGEPDDADLLTVTRDLSGDLRRRAGALRITAPPIESVLDRPRPHDRRPGLVVAAAVVAIALIATAVLRLADGPEPVQVGGTDAPPATQPVTLDEASGWRLTGVASPGGDGATSAGSGPTFFATDADHHRVLAIAAAPSTNPVGSGSVPSIPVDEVTEPTPGVLTIVGAPAPDPIFIFAAGLTRAELVAAVAGTTVEGDTFAVPNLPTAMKEVRPERGGQLLVFVSPAPDGTPRPLMMSVVRGDVSLEDLVVTSGVVKHLSPSTVRTASVAGRSTALIRSASSFYLAVAGGQPSSTILFSGDWDVDDATVEQLASSIRTLPPGDWDALRRRCATNDLFKTTPC